MDAIQNIGGNMEVGDLVSPKHTKSLFGIVVRKRLRSTPYGIVEQCLIQWSNQKSSYEQKKNLEVING